ncbi:MAG: cadherin-like beta sandwich domain-containing protein [Dysgonamonadaceae bacterium]|nr:cadherin-like beta sandwich domain-containing protein [Dysgonamonadaceae bacterium]
MKQIYLKNSHKYLIRTVSEFCDRVGVKWFKRAAITLTIALMSISGAMAANTNWSGNVSAGTTYDNITLTGNTTLTVAPSITCTVSGNVTGSYKLTVTGGGTLKLLGTANAWTGGLTVTNGIVKFGDDTHQGSYTTNSSATISIASGSNVDFYVTTTTAVSVYCPITGSGTFWKYGTGDLYWRGDVSGLTGRTTVSAGWLLVTHATTSYNSPTTVNANAILCFFRSTSSGSSTIDVNQTISGAGGVRAETIEGEFNVNLKVANTYTGGTVIHNQNTTNIVFLNVYNAGFASNRIHLNTAKTEFVWRAGQKTLDIPITGAGNVQKTGNTSTLTLKQASYSGYTSILDGTLIFMDCAPTGEINFHGETDASVNFTVSSDNTVTYANKIINGGKQIQKAYPGKLKLTSDAHTYTGQTVIYEGVLELGGTSTAGDISSTSDVLVDRSTAVLRFTPGKDYTFNKKIWGPGKVEKHSNYKLILSYDNNYDGGTTITLGSLYIGANSTTGSSTGSVGNGNVSVAAGCGLLFGRSGTSFTYGGVISGAGYISQISTGKTTLTGANTFTDYASIDRGTLALSGSGSIANSDGIWFTHADDGKFDISGVGSQCKIKSLQNGSDTGDEVVLGSKQLVIGTTDGTDGSGDFAGKISGTGTLVKTGFGTLKLTGTSTYTGRTTIQQGVLEFSALASFGAASSKISLTDRGKTIRWLSGNTADISGKIDNINSTTGTTFDVGANNVTFATALPSSSGPLYKEGTGTLIFTADNASTSTFTVSAGYLQLGNGGANGMVANNLSISSGAYVTFFMNSNKTYTGTITGTGGVDNFGQNNSSITFTKAVSNTGGFRTGGGVSSNNNNSIFKAAVTPNIVIMPGTASVVFDFDSNLTYSGGISGSYPSVNVFKKGSGTLTLNGTNTTTASLINESGTLKLSTDWRGNYAQEAGASLTVDGSRTVASLSLLGGTINFTYPSSKLNITGSASVGGAGTTTLNVSGVTGIVSNVVLMQAASGLATPDKFTLAVPGLPSGLTNSLTCTATQVQLNTAKGTQAAPSTPPVLQSKTHNEVVLQPVLNGEYSTSPSGPWQTSNLFINLSPSTTYNFYVRYVATATLEASPASPPLSVTTNAPPVVNPEFQGIVTLSPVSVAWGAPQSAAGLGLPSTVTINTSQGTMAASVSWDVSGYNTALETAQTFTATGTVTLPSGVDNSGGYSLTTTVAVTIGARPAQLSSDNSLASLSVAGYTLSPAFDPGVLNYTLQVPYSVTSITVNASANHNQASYYVSGAGGLSVGDNAVTVTVTAEDGTSRVYTITVTRDNVPNGLETASSGLKVWTSDNTLFVSVLKSTNMSVYNLSGTLYKQQTVTEGETAVTLPRGVYVVRIDGATRKVVVK